MAESMLKPFFVSSHWRGKRYLVSPFWDIGLAAGFSILFIAVVLLCVPSHVYNNTKSPLSNTLVLVFAFAAYFVNFPHFMSSYAIMYRGFFGKLKQYLAENKLFYVRYVIASIIVPTCLVGYVGYVLYLRDASMLYWSVLAMFFFVGWHYAKQAFGVLMVLSSIRGVRFSKTQRNVLYYNVHIVWISAWLRAAKFIPGFGKEAFVFNDLTVYGQNIHLPYYLINASTMMMWFSAALVMLVLVYKWFKEHQRVPLAAVLGYVSVYLYLVVVGQAYVLGLAIPFFHSAQYLLFVYALKRGEMHQHRQRDGEQVYLAQKYAVKFFVVATVLAGIVSFETIPQHLNQWTAGTFLYLPYMTAIHVFINIHHYFIDNVIWKRDEKEVWESLFYNEQTL